MEKSDWLEPFKFFQIGGRKPRPITSWKDFIESTSGWRSTLALCSQADMNENRGADIYASFYPWGQSLDFLLLFSPAFLHAQKLNFLTKIVKFVQDVYDEFAADAVLGPMVDFEFIPTKNHHPRLWPPRELTPFNSGNLIDFFFKKIL